MSKLSLIQRQQMAPKTQTLTPKIGTVKTATEVTALNVAIEIATEMAHGTATETERDAIVAGIADETGTETRT
jgi:hypothetical protein